MSAEVTGVHLPTAEISAEGFVAHPMHWLDLCERGTQFRLVRDGKAIALLIPVGAYLNRTGGPE